jgi:hypothetical protein
VYTTEKQERSRIKFILSLGQDVGAGGIQMGITEPRGLDNSRVRLVTHESASNQGWQGPAKRSHHTGLCRTFGGRGIPASQSERTGSARVL